MSSCCQNVADSDADVHHRGHCRVHCVNGFGCGAPTSAAERRPQSKAADLSARLSIAKKLKSKLSGKRRVELKCAGCVALQRHSVKQRQLQHTLGFVTRLSRDAAFQHESCVHKLFVKSRYKVFAQPKDFQLHEIYIH